MIKDYGISQRQACQMIKLPRSSYAYEPKPKDDGPVIEQLSLLVEKHPAIGFWKSYYRIRRKQYVWNHKKVYRVYCQMKLNIRRRHKKRLPERVKQQLFQPEDFNQVWSIDFMHDTLWDGSKYRILNIVDDYNREILAMEADTSLPALRLIRTLDNLKQTRGLPQMIRTDNGPEFISQQLNDYCLENKIQLIFIQPGKPTQNAYVERLNGNIRRELLNAYVFKSLKEVREKINDYVFDYNYERPHDSLDQQTPKDLIPL